VSCGTMLGVSRGEVAMAEEETCASPSFLPDMPTAIPMMQRMPMVPPMIHPMRLFAGRLDDDDAGDGDGDGDEGLSRKVSRSDGFPFSSSMVRFSRNVSSLSLMMLDMVLTYG